MTDFSQLSIRGQVVTASDSGWDEARLPWNLAADQRPAAVALVESADDVSKVIGFARDNGLKVTDGSVDPVSGKTPRGHDPDQDQRMRAVDIEENARIEAGVLAEEIGGAAKVGKSFCQASPNVGVTGHTLGGG
jgi:FAD/FMN-containing dehydrogenase